MTTESMLVWLGVLWALQQPAGTVKSQLHVSHLLRWVSASWITCSYGNRPAKEMGKLVSTPVIFPAYFNCIGYCMDLVSSVRFKSNFSFSLFHKITLDTLKSMQKVWIKHKTPWKRLFLPSSGADTGDSRIDIPCFIFPSIVS